MSTIPKHFGLTDKEESYMFKMLDKVRQETKKEYYQFKEKLAAKPVVGASSEHDLEDQDQKGRSSAKPVTQVVGAQSPERPSAADVPRERRGPRKPEPFRPRDFYMQSSAFRRHAPLKQPPAIARQAGTSKPVVLLRPRSRRRRLRSKSPGATVSKRVFIMSTPHGTPTLGAARSQYRHASSLSSLGSEYDDVGRLRRLRIRTHFLRDGMGGPRGKPLPKSGHEGSPAGQVTPVTRTFPTSIEEIIASLQSEAQQASDQTIKELIQSILGQNYDLTMEVGELD